MMWNEYDVKLFGSFTPYGIPFHSRNWATISRKNNEIFPHFATLKIAFLVTFLYSFLHNHKDMVNLKNIFFSKTIFQILS